MPQQLSESPSKGPHQPLLYHVPFTAYLKATPIGGKKFETERNLQKEADNIEQLLSTICDSEGTQFSYASPIAYTRQFGNATARFTIHGHACPRTTFTNNNFDQNRVINTGQYQVGAQYNAGNLTTTAEINTSVRNLKNQLENATGHIVFKMIYANIIFGESGTHFP